MKINCHYHPTKPAYWNCPKCGLNVCPECVTKREKDGYLQGESFHLCPKCNLEMEWLGVTNIIEPFWNRLPKFFGYPFALQPFILISCLAIASTLLPETGLISGILEALIWGILIKYSYEVLKSTAQGNLAPLKITSETITENFGQVFKQYTLFFILGAATVYVGYKTGFLMAILFLIFILFFLPAILILLVTTNSLFHSINPIIFVQLAFRIGGGYFLMYFFLILLLFAPGTVAYYVLTILPLNLKPLIITLINFASNYYTIISYHLMGYVLLQYHEEIGYRVEFENFRDPEAEKQQVQQTGQAPILKEVNLLIQEGKLDEAIAFIKQATQTAGITDLALSERYFNLLKMRKRKTELLEHCKTHLHLLAEANQKANACKIYIQCLAADPQFLPSPPTLFKIAGWLNESGKTKEAVTAFNRLIKSYPQDQLVPKAYFRAAQVFHDRLMSPDRARQILNGLIDKYPDHEIIPQVKNYLGHIY